MAVNNYLPAGQNPVLLPPSPPAYPQSGVPVGQPMALPPANPPAKKLAANWKPTVFDLGAIATVGATFLPAVKKRAALLRSTQAVAGVLTVLSALGIFVPAVREIGQADKMAKLLKMEDSFQPQS